MDEIPQQHLHSVTQANKTRADIALYCPLRTAELPDESHETSSQIWRWKSHKLRINELRKWITRAYSSREEIGVIIDQVCIGPFDQTTRKDSPKNICVILMFPSTLSDLLFLGFWAIRLFWKGPSLEPHICGRFMALYPVVLMMNCKEKFCNVVSTERSVLFHV
jgi:hypothetical protein